MRRSERLLPRQDCAPDWYITPASAGAMRDGNEHRPDAAPGHRSAAVQAGLHSPAAPVQGIQPFLTADQYWLENRYPSQHLHALPLRKARHQTGISYCYLMV